MNKMFRGKDGEYFPIEVKGVKVLGEDDIRLYASISLEVYQQIMSKELFNLYKDKIKPSGFMKFTGETPIEIEMGLDPALIDILALAVSLEEEPIKALILEKAVEGGDNLFICHDSWYAFTLAQQERLPADLAELGEIKTGFRTTWRDE